MRKYEGPPTRRWPVANMCGKLLVHYSFLTLRLQCILDSHAQQYDVSGSASCAEKRAEKRGSQPETDCSGKAYIP